MEDRTIWVLLLRIACVLSIGAAGLVYLIFVLVLRIITRDDCDLLPKGNTIARILRVK